MSGFLLSLLLFLTLLPSGTNALAPGDKAPAFSVSSGDEEVLTLDRIEKTNLVILYQSPDSAEENDVLQNQLSALYEESDRYEETTIVAPVVDCTSASWLLIPFWKRDIRSRSEEEDVTIYCDWDGRMLKDYDMTVDHSNVVVIDRSGTVRYVQRGKAGQERIDELKALLREFAKS